MVINKLRAGEGIKQQAVSILRVLARGAACDRADGAGQRASALPRRTGAGQPTQCNDCWATAAFDSRNRC